jgi:quinolinate synthase
VRVVQSIPADKEIIFLPDMYLGDFVAKKTGRTLHIYPGECHVHAHARPSDVTTMLDQHPGAEFLVHPECGCTSALVHQIGTGKIAPESAHILSTGGMVEYARKSSAQEFVVATEIGIIHRLEKDSPNKSFIPLRDDMVCQYMKMITVEKLLHTLEALVYEVKVAPDIAAKARLPIERMLAIG